MKNDAPNKVNLNTGEGLAPASSQTGHKPVRTSSRYENMIEHAKFDGMAAPKITQSQMRTLADLWDKTFIHFEQGALTKLQDATKEVLKPGDIYRSYVSKAVKGRNEDGRYNRAEEHLAQLMNQTTPREKVNFEAQYRVVQDNAVYELVNAGMGTRDATTNEEPTIVIGEYVDKAGAKHAVYATLNPVVLCYDLADEVAEHNHFAERAKLPSVEPYSCREFKKDGNGEVLYKVSVGTGLTGEHAYKEIPRSAMADFLKSSLAKVLEEAPKRDKG